MGAPYDGVSPLYGTTPWDGVNRTGTVFELSRGATHWNNKTIHDFSSFAGDGDTANAQLFIDGAGDIFGTTELGGDQGDGALFEFVPKNDGKGWSYKILHSFCVVVCAEGYEPSNGGALAMDAAGGVYGTTMFGAGGGGAVFKLLPNGKKSQISTLYSYSCGGSDCPDGYFAVGGVVLDSSGNLLALARYGGAVGYGTLLKLSPSGERLGRYDFCSQENCVDGKYPSATVIIDQTGNLFGTAWGGGAHDDGNGHGGTVFELTP